MSFHSWLPECRRIMIVNNHKKIIEMNIPGYTAEESICKTDKIYSRGEDVQFLYETIIVPATSECLQRCRYNQNLCIRQTHSIRDRGICYDKYLSRTDKCNHVVID